VKKNLLAIETSSPLLSVALKKGEDKTVQSTLKGFLRHAENLVPVIDRLLKKKKLSLHQIDAFLIGRGPGSFTGLRIGFATLKGFLSLVKKPCYGALSLDMIAEAIDLKAGSWLIVCLDARREKIYARFYRKETSSWQPKGRVQVLTFSELAARLPMEATLAGDALSRYKADFEKFLLSNPKRKIHFLPQKYWYPRASSLILRSGTLEKLDQPRDFLPLYLRRPEPEKKRKIHAHTR
jgi:tRNA threonylcarbamoyladenosine biosynthesis protein TsaB